MTYSLGKALAVTTLFAISAMVIGSFLIKENQEHDIVDSTALSRTGIKDLSVEYRENKIFLNVELLTPQTCPELIKSLGIHPIVIKSRTYKPDCSKISDTLMRVTYTREIST
jgi:hypothetical protein